MFKITWQDAREALKDSRALFFLFVLSFSFFYMHFRFYCEIADAQVRADAPEEQACVQGQHKVLVTRSPCRLPEDGQLL